jgi:hypothetical protein
MFAKTYIFSLSYLLLTGTVWILAQELEKIYPELVHELNGKRALKSIDYLGLIPVLVDLVQQQQKEIDALKKAIVK